MATLHSEEGRSPLMWAQSWQRCALCANELFVDSEPKLLPCLHSSCNQCLQQALEPDRDRDRDRDTHFGDNLTGEKTTNVCKICDEAFDVKNVTDNYFLLKHFLSTGKGIRGKGNSPQSSSHDALDDVQADQPQDSSRCACCEDEKSDLEYRCEECLGMVCVGCYDQHLKIKHLKSHQIMKRMRKKSEETVLKERMDSFARCDKHPGILELFCKTCDSLMCRDCLVSPTHKICKWEYASEIQKGFLDTLRGHTMKIKEKRDLIEGSKSIVSKRMSDLNLQEEKVKKDIEEFAESLKKAANELSTNLRASLETVCNQKRDQYKRNEEQLSDVSRSLTHLNMFLDLISSQNYDIGLLFSKSLIMNQMQNLLQKPCFNPKDEKDFVVNLEANIPEDWKCNFIRNSALIKDSDSGNSALPSQTQHSLALATLQPPSPSPRRISGDYNRRASADPNLNVHKSASRSSPAEVEVIGYTSAPYYVPNTMRAPPPAHSIPTHALSQFNALTAQFQGPLGSGLNTYSSQPSLNAANSQFTATPPMPSNASYNQRTNNIPVGAGAAQPPPQYPSMNRPSAEPQRVLNRVLSSDIPQSFGLIGAPQVARQQQSQQQLQQQQQQRLQQQGHRTTPLNRQSPIGAQQQQQPQQQPQQQYQVYPPLPARNQSQGTMTDSSSLQVGQGQAIHQHHLQKQLHHQQMIPPPPHQQHHQQQQQQLQQQHLMQQQQQLLQRQRQQQVQTQARLQQQLQQSLVGQRSAPPAGVESSFTRPNVTRTPDPQEAQQVQKIATWLKEPQGNQENNSNQVLSPLQRSNSQLQNLLSSNNVNATIAQAPTPPPTPTPQPFIVSHAGSQMPVHRQQHQHQPTQHRIRTDPTLALFQEFQEKARQATPPHAAQSTTRTPPPQAPVQRPAAVPSVPRISDDNGLISSSTSNEGSPTSAAILRNFRNKTTNGAKAVESHPKVATAAITPVAAVPAEAQSTTQSPSNSCSALVVEVNPVNVEENQKSEDEDDDDSSLENDEWCSVCGDGGELICCDNCPKAFHMNCHVPPLPSIPKKSWKCILCTDVFQDSEFAQSSAKNQTMTVNEQLICERIVLELFCDDKAKHFHRPVDSNKYHGYSNIIKNPMDLSTVRRKLSERITYLNVSSFVQDICLIFRNCFFYNKSYPNQETSIIVKNAVELEAKFYGMVHKYLQGNDSCIKKVGVSQRELIGGAADYSQPKKPRLA